MLATTNHLKMTSMALVLTTFLHAVPNLLGANAPPIDSTVMPSNSALKHSHKRDGSFAQKKLFCCSAHYKRAPNVQFLQWTLQWTLHRGLPRTT